MKGLPKTKITPDLSDVFEKNVRKRRKGQQRIGTKPKRIRAAHERTFQAELKRIRNVDVVELPKEKTLPEPVIFKPKKKKGRLARLKDKLRGNQNP